MVFDVTITGAGLVGCALAVSLGLQKKRVMLIDAKSLLLPPEESKKLAISYGSKRILENLGVWQDLNSVTAIDKIHVSHKGHFGRALLKKEHLKIPALGYVVSYRELQSRLLDSAKKIGVEISDESLVVNTDSCDKTAKVTFERKHQKNEIETYLAVIADGGSALAKKNMGKYRETKYNQEALLAIVACDKDHNNLAFERFTKDGPIALLPFGNSYALVWVGKPMESQKRLKLTSRDFLVSLQKYFGTRAGKFTSVADRKCVPLLMSFARDIVGNRLLVLGNAAQALHPIAGQGLNLGLRDMAELANLTSKSQNDALGSIHFLLQYKNSRLTDRSFGIAFTDLLTKMFSNNLKPLVLTRGLALSILDITPILRNFLMRRMIFGSKLT